MTTPSRFALLLAALFLAGCSGGPAIQPSPAPTNAPVQATAQPPQATTVASEAPAAVTVLPTENAPQSVTPTVDINCTETNPHPVGESIAKTYNASYEEVMTFFCTGVSFEDITIAYQTSKASGTDVKEVMTLWYDYDKNWDDVWTELGIQP